jgi:hypothetical protein
VGYGGIEKRGDDKDEASNEEQTYPRHVARAVSPHGTGSVLADQYAVKLLKNEFDERPRIHEAA